MCVSKKTFILCDHSDILYGGHVVNSFQEFHSVAIVFVGFFVPAKVFSRTMHEIDQKYKHYDVLRTSKHCFGLCLLHGTILLFYHSLIA